jgi:hypothetical protein
MQKQIITSTDSRFEMNRTYECRDSLGRAIIVRTTRRSGEFVTFLINGQSATRRVVANQAFESCSYKGMNLCSSHALCVK